MVYGSILMPFSAFLLRDAYMQVHMHSAFLGRRLSVERNSYGNVAGWLAGWLGVRHTPVLYQNG